MRRSCAIGLDAEVGRPTRRIVHVKYRRINAEHRADHIEALVLLGRLVVRVRPADFLHKSFVVMTVAGR